MLNYLAISNPFRVLGVYSNAKLSEILKNERRIKACINVGKPIQFESDSIFLNETNEGEPLKEWSKRYDHVDLVPFSKSNESRDSSGDTIYRLVGYDSTGSRTLVDASIDEIEGKSFNEVFAYIENHSDSLYVDRIDVDFPFFLYKTGVKRTPDILQKAMGTLSLPSEKVISGLFWFCNASSTDNEALEYLIHGDAESARSILCKDTDSFSSIVNVILKSTF